MARQRSRLFSIFLVIALSLSVLPSSSAFADRGSGSTKWDDPQFCSAWLAEHPGQMLPTRLHRRCVIAIVSTYLIDGLQNKDADAILLADTVTRGLVGRPP